jgi:hypothetical protein
MVSKSDKTELVSWIIRIGSFVMSIAIMVSSWFLNQAWNRITEVEHAVKALEITSASTNGNRFTTNDWVTAKSILDTERLAMDRRIIRMEESIPAIKDSLIEIKAQLRELNEKQ